MTQLALWARYDAAHPTVRIEHLEAGMTGNWHRITTVANPILWGASSSWVFPKENLTNRLDPNVWEWAAFQPL